MARDAVAEIRERTDIVDLVGAYVPLKKTGRSFKGNCPFHQERTPSFVVFPDSQNFHCFGCGKGGDLFTFFMEIEKVDFREALRELARRAGVVLDERSGVSGSVEDERREKLLQVLDLAATWFQHILLNTPAGEPGRELAAQRGLDAPTIERFRLGFAPDSWDSLIGMLRNRNIDLAVAMEAGLLQERQQGGHYDRFRNRFMFPIADRDGRVVGFGARAMGDAQPKYLNSPQSSLFDKSSLLYALHLAKEPIRARDQVVIVEGYMDAIAAHQFGHPNVVAAMGTALTEAQVGLVKRFSKNIVLALDADAAGQMATVRSLESMPDALDHTEVAVPDAQGMVRFERKLDARITILQLPEGKDPDELLRRTPERWPELVANALPFLDFLIDRVCAAVDPTDPRAKSAAFQRLAPILRQAGDAVVQQHYIAMTAGKLGVSESALWAELRRTPARGATTAAAPSPSPTPGRSIPRRVKHEDYLTAVLVVHPQICRDLLEAVTDDDLLDSRNREIIRLLRLDGADRVPTDVFLAGLDEAVEGHAERIIALLEGTPASLPGQIRQTATVSLNAIRRERLEFLMRQLQGELHSAQQEKDAHGVESLTDQIGRLAMQKQHFVPPVSPYFKDSRDDRSRF